MNDNVTEIEEILAEYKAKISYKNIRIADQRAYIDKLNEELRLMRTSTSWRLTAPLRKFIDIFRR